MTEDQAKEKWCPMVRIEEDTGSFNRIWNNLKKWFPLGDGKVDADKICNCIASDCMMWQATDNEYLPQDSNYPGEAKSKPAGYCGLAGKP